MKIKKSNYKESDICINDEYDFNMSNNSNKTKKVRNCRAHNCRKNNDIIIENLRLNRKKMREVSNVVYDIITSERSSVNSVNSVNNKSSVFDSDKEIIVISNEDDNFIKKRKTKGARYEDCAEEKNCDSVTPSNINNNVNNCTSVKKSKSNKHSVKTLSVSNENKINFFSYKRKNKNLKNNSKRLSEDENNNAFNIKHNVIEIDVSDKVDKKVDECNKSIINNKNISNSNKNISNSNKNISNSNKNINNSYKNINNSNKNINNSNKNISNSNNNNIIINNNIINNIINNINKNIIDNINNSIINNINDINNNFNNIVNNFNNINNNNSNNCYHNLDQKNVTKEGKRTSVFFSHELFEAENIKNTHKVIFSAYPQRVKEYEKERTTLSSGFCNKSSSYSTISVCKENKNSKDHCYRNVDSYSANSKSCSNINCKLFNAKLKDFLTDITEDKKEDIFIDCDSQCFPLLNGVKASYTTCAASDSYQIPFNKDYVNLLSSLSNYSASSHRVTTKNKAKSAFNNTISYASSSTIFSSSIFSSSSSFSTSSSSSSSSFSTSSSSFSTSSSSSFSTSSSSSSSFSTSSSSSFSTSSSSSFSTSSSSSFSTSSSSFFSTSSFYFSTSSSPSFSTSSSSISSSSISSSHSTSSISSSICHISSSSSGSSSISSSPFSCYSCISSSCALLSNVVKNNDYVSISSDDCYSNSNNSDEEEEQEEERNLLPATSRLYDCTSISLSSQNSKREKELLESKKSYHRNKGNSYKNCSLTFHNSNSLSAKVHTPERNNNLKSTFLSRKKNQQFKEDESLLNNIIHPNDLEKLLYFNGHIYNSYFKPPKLYMMLGENAMFKYSLIKNACIHTKVRGVRSLWSFMIKEQDVCRHFNSLPHKDIIQQCKHVLSDGVFEHNNIELAIVKDPLNPTYSLYKTKDNAPDGDNQDFEVFECPPLTLVWTGETIRRGENVLMGVIAGEVEDEGNLHKMRNPEKYSRRLHLPTYPVLWNDIVFKPKQKAIRKLADLKPKTAGELPFKFASYNKWNKLSFLQHCGISKCKKSALPLWENALKEENLLVTPLYYEGWNYYIVSNNPQYEIVCGTELAADLNSAAKYSDDFLPRHYEEYYVELLNKSLLRRSALDKQYVPPAWSLDIIRGKRIWEDGTNLSRDHPLHKIFPYLEKKNTTSIV